MSLERWEGNEFPERIGEVGKVCIVQRAFPLGEHPVVIVALNELQPPIGATPTTFSLIQTRWSLLTALAVLVAACSQQSSIVDNIEIPSDAIYCGTDSQIEPFSAWPFSAQTCVKTTVESDEAAWMLVEVGSGDEPGQSIILVSADGTMRRYGVAADGTVLVDDVCAEVVWNPIGDQETTEYLFSPLQCRDV